jgi:hypothetical protein
METSKISRERGKEVLIVESAKLANCEIRKIYQKKVLKSGETYWRCAIHKKYHFS